jgi:PPIC-type PPIASE domain
MNLAFQIGDSQIPCDRVLQQLHDSQLLPQLLREIVIDETIDRVAKEYGIDLTPTPAEFEKLSTQVEQITPFQGMNAEQISTITTRTLKLHKFKQAGWGHKVSSYFDTVKQQLHRVTYSILKVEDGLMAQELFFRLQSCELSFAELAVRYSQDETAQRGGLVGPIPIKYVSPAIAQVLLKMAPGELSPLFQIDRHYGFIQLNESTPAELDENIHQVLLDELFESWIQVQLANEIGANTEIEILDEQIAEQRSPELLPIDTPNIADGTSNNSQMVIDVFAPDFGYRDANLVEDLQVAATPIEIPEVTVVTEPEERDLAVTTGFFFPNRRKDKSIQSSTLATSTTTGTEPSPDLPISIDRLDPQSMSDLTQQSQQRSRLLAIGIGIAIASSLAAIGLSYYFDLPNRLDRPLQEGGDRG